MITHATNSPETKNQAIANNLQAPQNAEGQGLEFTDDRPEAVQLRKLHDAINNSSRVQQLKQYQEIANNSAGVKQLMSYQAMTNNSVGLKPPVQKKENNTGLPDNLKSGIENLSGYSMDDVKVHHNSDKPAQLNAHAYAQGSEIHVASGQEKHLPHEAWHVVQQKQGRVQPTVQMKGEVSVNDDAALEKEADTMGDMALQMKSKTELSNDKISNAGAGRTVQRMSTVEATQIGTDFDIALNPGQQTRLEDVRFTTALYTALHNNAGALSGCVKKDFGRLMRLFPFLQNGVPGVNAALLVRVNKFFETEFLSLHNNKTIAEYDAFMNAVARASGDEKMYMQVFFSQRTATRAPDLFLVDCVEMLASVLTVAPASAFFHVVQNATTNAQAVSLNAGNIADTARIIATNPPYGGFAGFTRWGEGNHGGGPANLKGHFLKHAMAFNDNTMTAEALDWWTTLSINPTYGEMDTAIGVKSFTDDEKTAMFGTTTPGNGATLAGTAGKTYVMENATTTYPELKAFFITQYEKTYGDYVIAQSAALGKLAVHESHDGIFISGAAGKLFIIGRLDAGGGAMGISSGYFATDIASKLDRQVLWYL